MYLITQSLAGNYDRSGRKVALLRKLMNYSAECAILSLSMPLQVRMATPVFERARLQPCREQRDINAALAVEGHVCQLPHRLFSL